MGLECVSGSAKKPKAYLVSRLRLCQVAKLDLRNKHLLIKGKKTGYEGCGIPLDLEGRFCGDRRRDRGRRLEVFRTRETCVRK